jgi:hypothetical protein
LTVRFRQYNLILSACQQIFGKFGGLVSRW